MRLILRRDQAQLKGFFGRDDGFAFQLSCRIELTSEEKSLVNKYRVADYVVNRLDGGSESCHTLVNFVQGVQYEVREVVGLLKAEAEIKESCQSVKMLLVLMATFGGEEVFEY